MLVFQFLFDVCSDVMFSFNIILALSTNLRAFAFSLVFVASVYRMLSGLIVLNDFFSLV